MEEVKSLTKKVLRFEEMLRRSDETNSRLEKELETARRMIKNERENNSVLKQENSKTANNFKSLKDNFVRLSEEVQALNIKLRAKQSQREHENQEWDRKLAGLRSEIEQRGII